MICCHEPSLGFRLPAVTPEEREDLHRLEEWATPVAEMGSWAGLGCFQRGVEPDWNNPDWIAWIA
jgi:hypothetical protein